jgi:hypothetical protein
MPLIWAAISAHGFGHAAQVVPVLNALGRLVPDLHVLLRTTVPAAFFTDRLAIPWKLSAVQQDIGCIQNGPLGIDVEATWLEHARFHATWTERVQAEVEAITAACPDAILADAPYLAVAAGAEAAIPTTALVSLTWDLILSEYPAPVSINRQLLLQSIRQAYARADLALRVTPAPKLESFGRVVDIGPIAEPAPPAREALDRILGLAPGDRTVLIGFGGIPLPSLPFAELDRRTGYRFLFDGPTPPESRRFTPIKSLPFSYKTLLASADIVMTKPGYGTIVEAVALRRPTVYVRRFNFADEQPLIDYLHRYGRAVQLSLSDFVEGRWEAALQQVAALPTPAISPPPITGAEEAAEVIRTLFLKSA